MKRSLLSVIVIMCVVASSRAQFFGMPMGMSMGCGLGWGTEAGSPAWCWQQQQMLNAQSAVINQMQMQQLQQGAQALAAMEAQLMNPPVIQMPTPNFSFSNVPTVDLSNINNGGNTDSGMATTNLGGSTMEKCEHCDGGYNYRKYYAGNGHINTQKKRCTFCHGTGVVRKRN